MRDACVLLSWGAGAYNLLEWMIDKMKLSKALVLRSMMRKLVFYSIVFLLGFTAACQPRSANTEAYPGPGLTMSITTSPPLSPSSTPPRIAIPDYLPGEVITTRTPQPTPTFVPFSWKLFSLPEVGIHFRYPEDWQANTPNRYSGQDGFFEVSIQPYASTVFGNLRTICTLEANLHKKDLYGETPYILDWQGWASEIKSWFGSGCGVMPAPDAPHAGEGVLFANYASNPGADQILVLRADSAHFLGILETLRMDAFVTATPSSGTYTSPLCILTAADPSPVVTQVAGLTITEYPIVDAACHPYNHFDSFQTRMYTVRPKLSDDWSNHDDPHQADQSNQIQVGQDSIRWEFDYTQVFPVGAPTQLNVLRDDQVIFTMAIPQFDPGGGPVRDFWSWDGHWVLEVENIVIVDGEIQNQSLGYTEMFNWHLVDSHPFYFFRQKDTFGVVYDGKTLPKQYDQLIHGFLCCDPGVYSIRSASIGAQFYAQRDGVWWFVVIEAMK